MRSSPIISLPLILWICLLVRCDESFERYAREIYQQPHEDAHADGYPKIYYAGESSLLQTTRNNTFTPRQNDLAYKDYYIVSYALGR